MTWPRPADPDLETIRERHACIPQDDLFTDQEDDDADDA